MGLDRVQRLRELYDQRDGIKDGRRWVSEVAQLLHELAPARANEFDDVTPVLFAGLSEIGVKPHWERALSIIRAGIADAVRTSNEGALPGRATKHARTPGQPLDVLVSWSGSASHALALALRDWLPTVLPFVDPWVSSEDIAKGKRWGRELATKLQDADYCIACITPGTEREPWVNFEAGAIAKVVAESHVSPVLLGVTPEDLEGLPLSQFQCTSFAKDDMRRLLTSMNHAAGSPLTDAKIGQNLQNTWSALARRVDKIPIEDATHDVADDDEDGLGTGVVLDEAEEEILVLIGGLGDETADAESIARRIGMRVIRAQYYLDRLVTAGYLYDLLSRSRPTAYGITAEGRAYVVENDLDE